MTMLEALAALVILGTSAAGFLGVFQNGARSMQSASAWNRATAVAEATLSEAVRSHAEGSAPDGFLENPDGLQARVESQPWSANVDDLIVRVTLPDGRAMTVHRLVRRR
jgi:type II secretory pathway pseudopilin PulG